MDPLLEGGSHSCVSCQRPRLLAGHEAEEKQLTTPLSSLPTWEMCKEGSRAGPEQKPKNIRLRDEVESDRQVLEMVGPLTAAEDSKRF